MESNSNDTFVSVGILGVRSRGTKMDRYLEKLMPIIMQRGFAHERIDDIVRSMDISKATFYKHFSSKEDVVEHVVDLAVYYFEQASIIIGDESISYIQHFQDAYRQSVAIANYLSDVFVSDLKQAYPTLWERLKQVQLQRQQQLQKCYERGIQAGIFQPINPVLISLQDELILRSLIDPSFCLEHGLTLRTLLYDYYILQKHQWLIPDASQQINDKPIEEFIDIMARKISLGLHTDPLC